MPERLVCACGAPITGPVPPCIRCDPCEARARDRWHAWLATLPETRIYDPRLPNPDAHITDGALPGRVRAWGR